MSSHTPLRSALKSQYHASLAMLRETIERCPADFWLSTQHKNAFWQVAYHTLYFTHLYLQRDEASFHPWPHQAAAQNADAIGDRVDPASPLPVIPHPYSQAQVLEYLAFCDDMVDAAVDALDLDSSESGFWWYTMSKLEHQLVNLRHVQHHAAQLADRLRSACDLGIDWVSAGSRRAAEGHES
jgi:hypothetical protein